MISEVEMERYLDAAALVAGLDIAPAYRAEVLANLMRTSVMAALILDFPLSDENADAAPVYVPGGPTA